MRRLLILTVFLLYFQVPTISACEPCKTTFCHAYASENFDLIVSGEIIYVDSLMAKLQVIDLFKGDTISNRITIWADSDYYNNVPFCEYYIDNTTAKLGKKGDKIIVGLKQILQKENEWDVYGEYRVPVFDDNTPLLQLVGDSVFGLIWSDEICTNWYWDTYRLKSMSYNDFKSSWSNGKFNCNLLNSINKKAIYQVSISQKNRRLSIHNPGMDKLSVQVFDLIGNELKSQYLNTNHTLLYLNNPGILLVKISDHSGNSMIEKILVK